VQTLYAVAYGITKAQRGKQAFSTVPKVYTVADTRSEPVLYPSGVLLHMVNPASMDDHYLLCEDILIVAKTCRFKLDMTRVPLHF
jgi:hypothetical protein